MRGVRSQRLLIALQDIRTADPIAADHIYAGHFSLAGKAVSTHGHSPFVIAAPSVAWSEALHGFGWLRHLRAADTALSRANAHALVEDWLNLDARGGKAMDRAIARDPRVVSRRLISWLSQSPIILENADHAFYRRFVRAIEAHVAALERALVEGLEGDARLTAIIACAHAGLCLEGANGLLRRATYLLSKELQEQILGDGGHVSRNPRVLVELLVDLLPTRQAFVARNIAAPEPLLNAIDRMTPMLRMFRHADGALAGFNGMGVSEPETLATLLAHGDVGGAAVLDAPYSGYQRLEAGGRHRHRRCRRAAALDVFKGGACRLSRVRILQRAASAGRQLRRAAGRCRRSARGGARHRRAFDAHRRRSFQLPFRFDRVEVARGGRDFGRTVAGRSQTLAR